MEGVRCQESWLYSTDDVVGSWGLTISLPSPVGTATASRYESNSVLTAPLVTSQTIGGVHTIELAKYNRDAKWSHTRYVKWNLLDENILELVEISTPEKLERNAIRLRLPCHIYHESCISLESRWTGKDTLMTTLLIAAEYGWIHKIDFQHTVPRTGAIGTAPLSMFYYVTARDLVSNSHYCFKLFSERADSPSCMTRVGIDTVSFGCMNGDVVVGRFDHSEGELRYGEYILKHVPVLKRLWSTMTLGFGGGRSDVPVVSICAAPHSELVFALSADMKLHVWNLKTLSEVCTFQCTHAPVAEDLSGTPPRSLMKYVAAIEDENDDGDRDTIGNLFVYVHNPAGSEKIEIFSIHQGAAQISLWRSLPLLQNTRSKNRFLSSFGVSSSKRGILQSVWALYVRDDKDASKSLQAHNLELLASEEEAPVSPLLSSANGGGDGEEGEVEPQTLYSLSLAQMQWQKHAMSTFQFPPSYIVHGDGSTPDIIDTFLAWIFRGERFVWKTLLMAVKSFCEKFLENSYNYSVNDRMFTVLERIFDIKDEATLRLELQKFSVKAIRMAIEECVSEEQNVLVNKEELEVEERGRVLDTFSLCILSAWRIAHSVQAIEFDVDSTFPILFKNGGVTAIRPCHPLEMMCAGQFYDLFEDVSSEINQQICDLLCSSYDMEENPTAADRTRSAIDDIPDNILHRVIKYYIADEEKMEFGHQSSHYGNTAKVTFTAGSCYQLAALLKRVTRGLSSCFPESSSVGMELRRNLEIFEDICWLSIRYCTIGSPSSQRKAIEGRSSDESEELSKLSKLSLLSSEDGGDDGRASGENAQNSTLFIRLLADCFIPRIQPGYEWSDLFRKFKYLLSNRPELYRFLSEHKQWVVLRDLLLKNDFKKGSFSPVVMCSTQRTPYEWYYLGLCYLHLGNIEEVEKCLLNVPTSSESSSGALGSGIATHAAMYPDLDLSDSFSCSTEATSMGLYPQLNEILDGSDSILVSDEFGPDISTLSRYYCHITELAGSMGQHALVCRFAREAIDSLRRDGVATLPTLTDLRVRIFNSSRKLNEYRQAYDCLLEMPPSERRTYVRELVKQLCESGRLDILCDITLWKHEDIVEDTIEIMDEKARSSTVHSTPNYYDILHVFYLARGMILHSARLNYGLCRRLIHKEVPTLDSLSRQVGAFITCISCFEMVDPTDAWYIPEIGSGARGVDDGGASDGQSEENSNYRPQEALEYNNFVLSLTDIVKQYCIAKSHLALLQHKSQSKKFTQSQTQVIPFLYSLSDCVPDLTSQARRCQALLVQEGLYFEAELLHMEFPEMKQELDFLFETLTRQCLSKQVIQAEFRTLGAIAAMDDLNVGNVDDDGGKGQGVHTADVIDKAMGISHSSEWWEVLRKFAESFDSPDTNFEYHQVIATTILRVDRHFQLPRWLHGNLIERYPEALARLYLTFNLLEEAGVCCATILSRAAETLRDPSTEGLPCAAYVSPSVIVSFEKQLDRCLHDKRFESFKDELERILARHVQQKRDFEDAKQSYLSQHPNMISV